MDTSMTGKRTTMTEATASPAAHDARVDKVDVVAALDGLD